MLLLWCNAGRGVNLGANPEGHLVAAASSGQALTKNQKKKLKKKLKKAGAGSQATDSGQLPEASHTDSDGSCGTGERLPKMLSHALQHQAHHCFLIERGWRHRFWSVKVMHVRNLRKRRTDCGKVVNS